MSKFNKTVVASKGKGRIVGIPKPEGFDETVVLPYEQGGSKLEGDFYVMHSELSGSGKSMKVVLMPEGTSSSDNPERITVLLPPTATPPPNGTRITNPILALAKDSDGADSVPYWAAPTEHVGSLRYVNVYLTGHSGVRKPMGLREAGAALLA